MIEIDSRLVATRAWVEWRMESDYLMTLFCRRMKGFETGDRQWFHRIVKGFYATKLNNFANS